MQVVLVVVDELPRRGEFRADDVLQRDGFEDVHPGCVDLVEHRLRDGTGGLELGLGQFAFEELNVVGEGLNALVGTG